MIIFFYQTNSLLLLAEIFQNVTPHDQMTESVRSILFLKVLSLKIMNHLAGKHLKEENKSQKR
jgi:hypothetical protein